MANVLKDEKKQQIIAWGRLGWSLRKIREATRVRRETISTYLRGASVEVWPPGRWRHESKANAAIEVITDFGVRLSGNETETAKGVSSVSRCEPYREIIELGLSRDRNRHCGSVPHGCAGSRDGNAVFGAIGMRQRFRNAGLLDLVVR
jgi:hypothetical protein